MQGVLSGQGAAIAHSYAHRNKSTRGSVVHGGRGRGGASIVESREGDVEDPDSSELALDGGGGISGRNSDGEGW